MKFAAALVACACALAISACTSPEPDSQDTSPLGIDMSSLVDEARQARASEQQLELLTRAITEKTLSFDDLNAQFLAGVECLEDAGFTVIVDKPAEVYPGVPHPAMRYQNPPGLSEDAASKISAQCDAAHFAFVDSFYVGQPVAIEAYLGTFDAQRDYIIDCLAQRGVTVDPESSATELLYAVSEEQASEAGMQLPPCYQGAVFNGYLRE